MSRSGSRVGLSRSGSYNFRSKYFMAINVPGAARLQASHTLQADGPGSQLEPPGDEDADTEPLDISGRRPQTLVQAALPGATRPTALPRACSSTETLLSTEIGSYDRAVARRLERSSSSAALAPWMRPPTPGDPGGASIEVPWQEAAPAAAPTVAQPQAAGPRRVREGVGLATSM